MQINRLKTAALLRSSGATIKKATQLRARKKKKRSKYKNALLERFTLKISGLSLYDQCFFIKCLATYNKPFLN